VNVTEAEARKLWCPQARVAFMGQHVGNRVSSAMIRLGVKQADQGDTRDLNYLREHQADCHCLASGCMFWKFTGYRQVPSSVRGQDEAHGTCGIAADYPLTGLWKFDPHSGEPL
jgi:hypothetical protein